MADKSYVVKAACAVVYNADRTAAVTVPRGGKVPADADSEHVQLLVDRGLIAEAKDGDFAGGLDVDPEASPPFAGTDEDETRASSRRRASASSD